MSRSPRPATDWKTTNTKDMPRTTSKWLVFDDIGTKSDQFVAKPRYHDPGRDHHKDCQLCDKHRE